MTTSESNTFQIWGRTYITDDHHDPVKSDDTDSISSIQIAITNAQYTSGDVPTSVSEGQQLLANLLKTNFEFDSHIIGQESYFERIREQEPDIPWKAEVFWAFWYLDTITNN
ncbi:hypothetical protein A3B64_00445 [candidate division WWE3 bacterium RIFCSPLOWO2_01_FULL_37_24]|nr:MAG: hypothetical protein A3B64_00445 [candidate division WWE3 bacterium RIFCSPLOWO2_01_FULL_37_24]